MAHVIDELKSTIASLKAELQREKAKNASCKRREKIEEMSSEVVDTNPYRSVFVINKYTDDIP